MGNSGVFTTQAEDRSHFDLGEQSFDATLDLSGKAAALLTTHPRGDLISGMVVQFKQAGAYVNMGILPRLLNPIEREMFFNPFTIRGLDILILSGATPTSLRQVLHTSESVLNPGASILVLLSADPEMESAIRFFATSFSGKKIRVNAFICHSNPQPPYTIIASGAMRNLNHCALFFCCDASQRLTGQMIHVRLN